MDDQIEQELIRSNAYKKQSIFYLGVILLSMVSAVYFYLELEKKKEQLEKTIEEREFANALLSDANKELENTQQILTDKRDSLSAIISKIEELNSDPEFYKKFNNIALSAKSSSHLKPAPPNNYYAANSVDGKARTAWCEGIDGGGFGQSLTIELNKELAIRGMKIMNGYNKHENNIDSFYRNGRIKRATLSFSDGTTETIELEDIKGFQTIEFREKKVTQFVKITLEDVYNAEDGDTCVSEVEVLFFN